MALKLTLKPGEKFVINGAVVVNGDRRTRLVIQNRVTVLREKDILLPRDATSPAKRIYLPIMMMYLEKDSERSYYEEFVQRITEFITAIADREALETCVRVIECVHAKEYYKGLMACRKLLPFEKERLEYVAPKL
jgi:flagellar protein FlbT